MTEDYIKELLKQRQEVLNKAQRLAKDNCKWCHGKGVRTFVVGQKKSERQDVIRLCKCVNKNLNKLNAIKRGEYHEDGEFDLKGRVKEVPIKRRNNKKRNGKRIEEIEGRVGGKTGEFGICGKTSENNEGIRDGMGV